jgi:poly(3-hydroxybutyrate) depolymerase
MNSFAQGLSCVFVFALAGLSGACGGGDGGAVGASGPGIDTSKSCKEVFNPDKAAAGDDCSPSYELYCKTSPSSLLNDRMVDACSGVVVSTGTVSAGVLSSDWVMLSPGTPPAGGVSGTLVVALHWADGNGPTMANRMHFSELVRARGVTVVLPTAPGLIGTRTWGTSVIVPTTSVNQRIELITALIGQIRTGNYTGKEPGSGTRSAGITLLVGASGGGAMAFRYACAHPELVSGAEMVAPDIKSDSIDACPSTSSFASVQISGDRDPLEDYSYITATFQKLYTNNGCDASTMKRNALAAPHAAEDGVEGLDLQWFKACSRGVGSALLTVKGGGHTWAGSVYQLPVEIYGPVTQDFDATVQGYDLLVYELNNGG